MHLDPTTVLCIRLGHLIICTYSQIVSIGSLEKEQQKADQLILKEKAILVATHTTPEQMTLSFVEMEVDDTIKLFPAEPIDTTVLRRPTRTEVLSELSKYTIVHFARPQMILLRAICSSRTRKLYFSLSRISHH